MKLPLKNIRENYNKEERLEEDSLKRIKPHLEKSGLNSLE